MRIAEIEYETKRVKLDLALDPSSLVFRQQVNKSIITKSIAWEYENEARVLFHPNYCIRNENSDFEFIQLHPEAITGVDLGFRMPASERLKLTKLLQHDDFSHVSIREAIQDESEFRLHYRPWID